MCNLYLINERILLYSDYPAQAADSYLFWANSPVVKAFVFLWSIALAAAVMFQVASIV